MAGTDPTEPLIFHPCHKVKSAGEIQGKERSTAITKEGIASAIRVKGAQAFGTFYARAVQLAAHELHAAHKGLSCSPQASAQQQ